MVCVSDDFFPFFSLREAFMKHDPCSYQVKPHHSADTAEAKLLTWKWSRQSGLLGGVQERLVVVSST